MGDRHKDALRIILDGKMEIRFHSIKMIMMQDRIISKNNKYNH